MSQPRLELEVFAPRSVARIADCTSQNVRVATEKGRLRAFLVTAEGHRLYLRQDVEEWIARRDLARAARRRNGKGTPHVEESDR